MRLRLSTLAVLLLTSCVSRESAPEAPLPTHVAAPNFVSDAVFHAVSAGATAQAPQFSAHVEATGQLAVTFPSPDGAPLVFTLAPAVMTRGTQAVVASGNTLEVNAGGDVRVDHGAWRDRVRSSAAELEQAWEFASAPVGTGDLHVRIGVQGARISHIDDEGLHFGDGQKVRLTYGHATWVDASGRRTPIRGHFNGSDIFFDVSESILGDTKWPAVLDPTIAPELELDVPTYGSYPHAVYEGAIAWGEGGYLTIWREYYSSGNDSILGARVLADGGSLDPVGFVIANQGTSNGYYNPQAAYATLPDGGGLFLATWEHHYYGDNNVYGARIVPNWSGSPLILNMTGDAGINGNILFQDTSTDCGSNGCYGRAVNSSLGANSTGFLMAWDTNVFDATTDNQRTDIDARRIPFFGNPGATFKVFISTSNTSGKAASVAGLSSGEFVVAWSETNPSGWRPRANIVASSGSGAGTPIALAAVDSLVVAAPETACTSAQCMVVWQGDGPMGTAIYAQRFDSAGVSPDVANPLTLGTPGTYSETAPNVAASATDYLVSWNRSGATWYSKLNTTGAIGAPLNWYSTSLRDIATSGAGNGVGLYIYSNNNGAHARYTTPSNPSNGLDLTLCQYGLTAASPTTAWDGRQFRTAWYEPSGNAGIKGNIITGLGLLALNSAPTIDSVSYISDVSLVSADSGVLLFSENGSFSNPATPKVRWFKADGGTNTEVTLSSASGASSLKGASTSSQGGAAVWRGAMGDIAIKFMASDYSVILPGNPALSITSAGGVRRSPTIASNRTDYEVVWEDDDGGLGHLASTRVTAGRAVISSGGLIASSDQVNTGGLQPVIASDGNNYLLVWRKSSDLWARVIDRDGGFLSGEMALVTSAGDQTEPALAFDGTNYLLVWTDSRNGNSDIYGTQVTPGGLAQGEFVIAQGTTNEFSPSVAAKSPSMAVVTYLKYEPSLVHQTNRARARVLTFGQLLNAYTQFVTTPYNTPVNITLTGTLADGGTSIGRAPDGGDALAYMIARAPSRGMLNAGTGASRTYTPTSGLSGFDSFDYYVTDGVTSSLAARINVQVLAQVIDAGSGSDSGVDAGSGSDSGVDAGSGSDAGVDAGSGSDAGVDAGSGSDAGVDAGNSADAGIDAGAADAGPKPDGGSDAGGFDAGTPDAGLFDAGSDAGGVADAGNSDAGTYDAGPAGGGSAGGGSTGGGSTGGGSAGGGSAGGGSTGGGSAGGGSAGGGSAGGGSAGGGSAGGGSAIDAGTDASVTFDAGVADSGSPPVDAGPADSGVADDAGTSVDAGSANDAGSSGGGTALGGGNEMGGGSESGGGSAGGGSNTGGGSAAVDAGTGDAPDAGPDSLYSWKGFGCGCQGSAGSAPLLGLFALWVLRRRKVAAAVVAVGLMASQARAEDAEKPRLLFSGVSCPSGASKAQAQALEEFIQTELSKLRVYNVLSASDVSALMGIERQKQMMGCTDDAKCFIEIGGAMNAKRALTASLTQLGKSWLLNLTLLDTSAGKALARVGRRLKGDEGLEHGLDDVEPMLRELIGQDSSVALPKAAPAGPPEVTAKNDTPETAVTNQFTLGVRGEFDTLGIAFAPAISGTFTRGMFGVAAAGIIAPHPGIRVEGRLVPFTWKVRPYLGVGLTAMIPAVAARGALGASVPVGPIVISADVAAEYAFVIPAGYRPLAVLASLGVAWGF